MTLFGTPIAVFAVLALYYFCLSSQRLDSRLSPQGCRMSTMSPSYVLQHTMNDSWTPLARRYSLWLYREVGWDVQQVEGRHPAGVPVLFIPGNAGSSRQGRSIASSAARQYYAKPGIIAHEFASRNMKPIDFFAVEFNEDLSAFHGPTLDLQTAYTASAISYILSRYPLKTRIIIMGHSMGGIVAASLLPSPHVAAIIVMSTPFATPPANFDAHIHRLYQKMHAAIEEHSTPILSLCGGAADLQIPSESCIIPPSPFGAFRRSVFTSGMEGCWTGVGHKEMVWCHQVRWRIARAALEMQTASNPTSRGDILDRWLRDGHILPDIPERSPVELALKDANIENEQLILESPTVSETYLLPPPISNSSQSPDAAVLTVLVSRGTISPVSPQHPLPLQVSVMMCSSSLDLSQETMLCESLKPKVLKLIPNPTPGEVFPVPHQGSDESEGVALFEAQVTPSLNPPKDQQWIAIQVENADGRGWVAAGFSHHEKPITNMASTFSLLFSDALITIPSRDTLLTSISLPNLLSHVLLVYRVEPIFVHGSSCEGALLAPLIIHTSHPEETHYYPVNNQRVQPILLHTHNPGPFVPQVFDKSRGVHFVVYSANTKTCRQSLQGFRISIDLEATLGRWAPRYIATLASWCIGVVALIMFYSWREGEVYYVMPTVEQSLAIYEKMLFRVLLPAVFLLSFVPFPSKYYMGHCGEPIFSPIAPLILLMASGLIYISYWGLRWVINVVGSFARAHFPSRPDREAAGSRTLLSMGLIVLLVFFFVPWQITFLGAWLFHLYTCILMSPSHGSCHTTPKVCNGQLKRITQNGASYDDNSDARTALQQSNHYQHNIHILVFMTWLLPLVAPVLAVWVRTLISVGWTAPVHLDRSAVKVLPYLILVDFASWTNKPFLEKQSFEPVSIRWMFALTAVNAFWDSRRFFAIYDVASVAMSLVVVTRIGRRYWDARC